jgi:sugar lactone lactonase YvrE
MAAVEEIAVNVMGLRARARAGMLLALLAGGGAFTGTVLASLPARAATPTRGDVYAAVGGGKIGHYTSTGTLVETLDSTVSTFEDDGLCFDPAGNLYSTQGFPNTGQVADTVSKFDSSGHLVAANFGTGYTGHPESCTVDGHGNLYVGQPDGSRQVLELSPSGAPVASYTVATEDRGTDWITLAADGCTLVYTSEGSHLKRFDACTNTQLPDLAAMAAPHCYAVRVRPNGEVLVACESSLYRLSSTGAVLQTYQAASLNPAERFVFAMNLDPDNATFWTAGFDTHSVYRVNIASGALVTSFSAPGAGPLGGLAVANEINVPFPTPTPTPVPTGTPTPKPTGPGLPRTGATAPAARPAP